MVCLGLKLAAADESTELWRHPSYVLLNTTLLLISYLYLHI